MKRRFLIWHEESQSEENVAQNVEPERVLL